MASLSGPGWEKGRCCKSGGRVTAHWQPSASSLAREERLVRLRCPPHAETSKLEIREEQAFTLKR